MLITCNNYLVTCNKHVITIIPISEDSPNYLLHVIKHLLHAYYM
jgi:hypothetical protein